MRLKACVGVWVSKTIVTCIFAKCPIKKEYCLHTDRDIKCKHFCELGTADGYVSIICDHKEETKCSSDSG